MDNTTRYILYYKPVENGMLRPEQYGEEHYGRGTLRQVTEIFLSKSRWTYLLTGKTLQLCRKPNHKVHHWHTEAFIRELQGIVCYRIMWYGTVWRGVVWLGIVWCEMVWNGVVWNGMVWCGMYGMVWYGNDQISQTIPLFQGVNLLFL